MAEGSGAAVPPSAQPQCRLGGGAAAPAPGRLCRGVGGGGCGLGLARQLVRRLRRWGRRALRVAAAASSSQPRRRVRQYDPLSYARNFDLGGCGDADDADAARIYYSCSFSSRFVLAPASSSSAGTGAASASAAVATR